MAKLDSRQMVREVLGLGIVLAFLPVLGSFIATYVGDANTSAFGVAIGWILDVIVLALYIMSLWDRLGGGK